MPKLNVNNQNISVFLAVVLLGLICFAGIQSYTVDSEIWSLYTSKFLLESGHHLYSVYTKPLFHLILRALFLMDLDSYQHLLVGKGLFILVFVLLNIAVYRLFNLITKQKTSATVAMLLLLANPSWIADGFRIRADLLSMVFSVFAINTVISSPDKLKWIRIAILIVLSVLATPKSLIWNIPIVVFVLGISLRKIFEAKKLRVFFLAILGNSIFLYVIYQSFLPVRIGVRSAFSFLLGSSIYLQPFSKIAFLMDLLIVLNAIYASPIFWSAILVFMCGALYFLYKKERKIFSSLVLSYIILILLFLAYSPKNSYTWAMMTVFFSLPFSFFLKEINLRLHKAAIFVLILLLFGHGVYWIRVIQKRHSGDEVYQFVSDLDKFIGNRNLIVFDSTGLLIRKGNSNVYVGYGDLTGNGLAIDNLKRTPPDIIIMTDRIKSYLPEIFDEIAADQYIESTPGVFVRNEILLQGSFASKIAPSSIFNQRLLWFPQN